MTKIDDDDDDVIITTRQQVERRIERNKKRNTLTLSWIRLAIEREKVAEKVCLF